MKVKMNGITVHVPDDLGQAYVAAGMAEEIKEEQPVKPVKRPEIVDPLEEVDEITIAAEKEILNEEPEGDSNES